MSPRSAKQFDDIRKEKKEHIMDVALELFAENGYHATSVNMIAQKAKISKGLTYNYFESKSDILNQIISQGFNEIFKNFDLNKDGTLTEEEFVYFIRQNFRILKDNLPYWKLFFALLLQPPVSETSALDYKKFAEPLFEMLIAFISSKGSKDPEADLIAISTMLEGAFLYLVAAPTVFSTNKLEDAVIQAAFKIINR